MCFMLQNLCVACFLPVIFSLLSNIYFCLGCVVMLCTVADENFFSIGTHLQLNLE